MFSISSRLTYAAVWLRKQLAEPNWLNSISAAAFVIFIVSTFFLRGMHALAVGMIILTAILAFPTGIAAETVRRNVWLWLLGAFFSAWTVLGIAAGGPGYKGSDFFNFALLGAFFLFIAQVS
ncbi:MAG TPA: hypothetical protein VFF61_00980, partial [Microvirga sp.]|nr:hypothetical protein [Microvirga sp.]